MKKNILIVTPSFKHGGTNRSLLNFLSLIDSKNYNFFVFGMDPNGIFKNKLPNCTILSENIFITSLMSFTVIKEEKNILKKVFFILVRVIRRIGKMFKLDFSDIIFRFVSKKYSNNKFDTIIAFQEGLATLFVSYMKANKLIAWIRCDYKNYLKLNNLTSGETNIYDRFNDIICVSDYTKSTFCDCIPLNTFKVKAIHNIIDFKNIKEKSKLNQNLDKRFDNSSFTIISVGRLDVVKRFTEIPKIVSELIAEGFMFNWYLIGGGGDELKQLLKEITCYKVMHNFIYLGEIDNPYPYIALSDLLVVTSTSEACPNVINESKILNIPVISTNFGSVYEFLDDGESGFISTFENISEKIKIMISEKAFYDKIKSNLNSFNYNNNVIINNIYELL